MDNRLAELEQQKALQEAAASAQRDEWEERIRSSQLGEESMRKEAHSLRYVKSTAWGTSSPSDVKLIHSELILNEMVTLMALS